MMETHFRRVWVGCYLRIHNDIELPPTRSMFCEWSQSASLSPRRRRCDIGGSWTFDTPIGSVTSFGQRLALPYFLTTRSPLGDNRLGRRSDSILPSPAPSPPAHEEREPTESYSPAKGETNARATHGFSPSPNAEEIRWQRRIARPKRKKTTKFHEPWTTTALDPSLAHSAETAAASPKTKLFWPN